MIPAFLPIPWFLGNPWFPAPRGPRPGSLRGSQGSSRLPGPSPCSACAPPSCPGLALAGLPWLRLARRCLALAGSAGLAGWLGWLGWPGWLVAQAWGLA